MAFTLGMMVDLCMAFKLGMMVDLCLAYNTHAHVEDLDLDARSQWVSKGKNSALNDLDNQASNKHYTCYNGRPFFFFFYMTLI